jgi:hypothetical protein
MRSGATRSSYGPYLALDASSAAASRRWMWLSL